jgi:hypothetical protein
MIDAFGVEISKGLRLDKFARSKVGQKILTDAPLKPNEFFHGSKNPEAVRREGFKITNQNMNTHGSAVYVTNSKNEAIRYAGARHKVDGKSVGADYSDKKALNRTLRVKVPKKSTFEQYHVAGNIDNAVKSGHIGTRVETTHAVQDPSKVKVVPNRYRLKALTRKNKIERKIKSQSGTRVVLHNGELRQYLEPYKGKTSRLRPTAAQLDRGMQDEIVRRKDISMPKKNVMYRKSRTMWDTRGMP